MRTDRTPDSKVDGRIDAIERFDRMSGGSPSCFSRLESRLDYVGAFLKDSGNANDIMVVRGGRATDHGQHVLHGDAHHLAGVRSDAGQLWRTEVVEIYVAKAEADIEDNDVWTEYTTGVVKTSRVLPSKSKRPSQ